MIIDVHAHLASSKIFPQKFIEGIAASLIKEGESTSAVASILRTSLRDDNGTGLLRQMEEANIDRTILLIADFGLSLGEPPWSLERIHEHHQTLSEASGGRLFWFSGVDPRRGKAGLDLLSRYLKTSTCLGFKLYPPCGFELDDPALFPFYQICSDRGKPVLTHTGASVPNLKTEARYPQSIRKVLRLFPDLNFIMAHGIVWDPEGSLNILSEFKNAYVDISAFQLLLKDVDAFQKLMNYCFDRVPDRILFGTDFPLYRFRGKQRTWVDILLDIAKDKSHEGRLLLGENAARILEIP